MNQRSKNPSASKHGTDARYRYGKCRCDTCVKANYERKKTYRNGTGKQTYKKVKREFYLRNRERLAKESKRYRDQNPSVRLRRLYGIDVVDFERFRNEQNNACAICKRSFEHAKPLVDHCHKTGKVRGLLCDPCNRGLGAFRDDPEALAIAAEYLRR